MTGHTEKKKNLVMEKPTVISLNYALFFNGSDTDD